MSTTVWLAVGLGLLAGTMGGMFGIGGGLVMVPGMILLLALEQRQAFGTSLLAQLLPVGVLGVAEYWRRGEVNLAIGLALGVGLFVGTWCGARLVGIIPREPMKQSYGAFLICVGVYFLLVSGTPAARRKQEPAPTPHVSAQPPESTQR